MMSYAALFISALIAATLVPMQSEAVLVGLLIAGQKPIMWIVIVATVGNVLGAIINWYFGFFYFDTKVTLGFLHQKDSLIGQRLGIPGTVVGRSLEVGCQLWVTR